MRIASMVLALLIGVGPRPLPPTVSARSLMPSGWLKLVLTYLVPYGVCTYGTAAQQLNSREAGDESMREV